MLCDVSAGFFVLICPWCFAAEPLYDQLQCLNIESELHKIMYVLVIDLFFIGVSVVCLEMQKGIRSCSLFKMCVKYW